MNKKILVSLATMGAVAALVVGGTIAFFSDTETSTGNTLTAGELDLLIDNECYYNGGKCICEGTNGDEVCTWQGGDFAGESCSCYWEFDNLDDKLFFDLQDLKPGDWEEDTISLRVQNDAWACAKITLTENSDNTCTEPEEEAEGAEECDEADNWSGDLADELYFIWWADDGDNVLEQDEAGHVVEGNLNWLMTEEDVPWYGAGPNEMLLTLADSAHNFWNPGVGEPLKAEDEAGEPKTYYIGKAFCYGVMDYTPLPQGEGVDPIQTSFFTCDGEGPGNEGQTDRVVADIEFEVVQSRNNSGFLCAEHEQPGT